MKDGMDPALMQEPIPSFMMPGLERQLLAAWLIFHVFFLIIIKYFHECTG
ncbi:hypothetical protein CBFG_03516 [Clostridiales bacterium 1_7_47FAA]|nr:hypothetical protein CBFG_03516 [Clostridiales bacterium 1_7_47FAA]